MSKPAILLIEDDRWLADSYALTLGTLYAVQVVGDADEAMEAIDEQVFDLIVADVMLERGLVIDLLHELQSHTDTSSIPVILCSSLAAVMRPDDLRAYGVVDVIDKAVVTPAGLRIAAQRALSLKEA